MKEILGIKLYSIGEVGTLLGVTNQTIAKYIREGKLSARTIGKRYFVSEENLKKFVTE